MQKTKRFRLLTVLLTVVMMFALSIQAYAATSKPVTQDGITATLVTDKDSYKAGESVNATVKVENNSGQDVFVFTQITVPSAVKLTGASAFDAVLANGQAWTSAAGVLNGTAGTTATGDNMQAGLWTVVSILAIGGVVALLVYGKNRKTWVSMMLCVVMIGGLMAAAVPAQAAGVSGSMSVSCAIQVDGKAAEVTAVVNYIVGYEAGSAATTTTPSETPTVAPTTAPSEDPTVAPTTAPSEEPTEAPTTAPSEEPTEAPSEEPTEAPSEEPTEAPSEEPTEAPTTAPSEEPTEAPTTAPSEEPTEAPSEEPTEAPSEEPTEAPSEEPTEAPSEEPTEAPSEEPTEAPTETPSETAYYVVWDDFTFSEINSYTEGMFSSWDVVLPQGAPTKASDGASFVDGSGYAKGQALRAFNAIADDFTVEFTMRAAAGMDDAIIDFKNEDTTAIRFTIEDDKLLVGGEELCALPVNTLKNFKLHISPANGTYTISIDGATVMDGDAAKEFAFDNSAEAIDRFYIETGVEATGQVIIGTLRIYVGYYVNDKFLDGTNLAINDEWTLIGDAATIYKKGTQGPDKYNVLLENGEGITRDVTFEQDGAWVEFQQLMEENVGEFVMTLADDAGNTFKVATKNGKFGYYNGTEFVGLYDCVANLWYHVMIKQTDAGTELYLNHKLKADELPNIKFTKMTFEAIGGEAMLDDVIVKDWIPLPDDYVPEPVAVEKEEGATLVGLQSCNLWVEGEHFGYDWLTDWEERTPVLGYYDEMLPEVADWELKFKVEHGIDFELFCWYRTTDGQNEPIKSPRNVRALHDGYMNAEYSDMMDFAITWEAGSGGLDFNDFKENIVPYWIEQYFKDDRYLLVDNKPVVGMYNINKLKSYFGGTIAGVKEAMDYLRQACIDAGFDGAYIIMSNSSVSSAKDIAQAGFDGQYAYTWGSTSYTIVAQTKGMEGIQSELVAAGLPESGVIPTVSMGYWDKAWDRDDGAYCTTEQFQTVLEWVRDDLIPTLDQNSIGSKMVLLDNWNEYGEGHFIMPANLAGFGYLDAVKEVFSDSEACDEEVQHVIPTAEQRARINHMYIQDRHVVLVDKDGGASNIVPIDGYNWTFDTEDNYEGWTVGSSDGRWIKDLTLDEVKDGKFHGVTPTPAELEAAVAAGTLPSGATADPSLMSPDNLNLNAKEAIAIKIRMRGVGGLESIGKPAIYFVTTEDQKYTGGKMVAALYEELGDGYAEVTFDMTTNSLWTGTIKQFRFDPIERDGEFWIDSIQIMRRAESGDAEVYMDGSRVYTSAPIEVVDGTYMFPVDELDTLTDVYVNESLEGDRLYINTETVFYEFPYEGDTKMFANGVAVDSVGVVTINDMLYVPIIDIFENNGTVTDALGETHPAYTVTVTPATADAKTKIHINKYVDPSILKGYYFASSNEGWTYGGGDTEKTPVINGIGALEIVGKGQNTKFWSPEASEKQFNVNMAKADHIRMIVKTDAATENPTIKMDVFGDGTAWSYTYNITLTDDMKNDAGYYVVLLDLAEAKAAGLKPASELDRVCIWYYDSTAGGIQTFSMDSFEILDLVEDGIEDEDPEEAAKIVIEESPYTIYDWDFTESIVEWCGGGTTAIGYDSEKEALMVTVKGQRANAWSSNNSGNAIPNPLNISAADATAVLVRVESEAELTTMGLDVQFVDESGNSAGFAYYTNIPYVTDVNGDLYALVDLTTSTSYDSTKTIGRINVYPIGNTITEADNGKVVYIRSVEILDQNWYIEFDSEYFANGHGSFCTGGTTVILNTDATLEVCPPTNAADFNPRIWSMNNVAGSAVPVAPYEYTADDVTHVRVRLKAVVPETLPDTMTDDEKAAFAEITSEELKMNIAYSDGSSTAAKKLAYEIGTEDFVTLTFDISDIYANGKTLGRIGFEVFDGGNELLCKAGVSVLIDSVQFIRRTSEDDESQALKVLIIGNSITQHAPNLNYGWAADWGMAATSADKDYVHLLEDSILAKNGAVEVKAVNIAEYEKYFYDWSLISDTKDKYANWNADIIIATFGANVKNGANENDSSYENDYTFTPAKYKKIIDKFNPDGDATVIAGATVLTSEQIVKIIKDAATEYGYTYVDMTEWTADEYKAYDYEDEILAYYYEVTGDTSKTEVYAGVLGHPGDKGMAKIAEELWGALEPMIPQGIPAEDPDDGGEGGEEESDILKAYYFDENTQGWSTGGLGGNWQTGGLFLMDFTGQTNTGAGWKSPTSGSYAANKLGIDPKELGSVVITVIVEDGVVPDTAELQCYSDDHATLKLKITAKYELVSGNIYKATFDTLELGANCGESELLNAVRINGMKVLGEATQGKYYLDSVEFMRIGDDVVVPEMVSGDDAGAWAEGDATYASLAKGYYFDNGAEGWINGGVTGVQAVRDLLIVTGKDAGGARIWSTNDGTQTNYNPLNIATADADTIRIRINTDVENPELILNVEYKAVDGSSAKTWGSGKVPYTVDEDGWTVVTIDLTASEYHTEEYLIHRLNLYPLGQTEAAKTETVNIDYVEVLKKAEVPVTPEEPAEPTYTVVKAFNFDSTTEGFNQGGALNKIEAVDGTLLATAGDTNLRIWTPYVNLATTDVTHLRIKVKTTATDPQFRAYGEFDNVTTDAISYAGVSYASGTEDYQEVIIDLTAASQWSTKTELDRLCIYPFSNNVGETATIDSVEFLKLVTE